MILTGKEIQRKIEEGEINIFPFDERKINPNSYNYHLDNKLSIVPPELSRGESKNTHEEFIYIPKEGYVLEPNKIYLGNTLEVIGSHKYVTSLIGRSSLGRLGLFLQISADLGNLGPAHKWTLEIVCVQPIRIYPYMVIGQVSFWEPQGNIDTYKGKYADFDDPKFGVYGKEGLFL